MPTPKSKQAPYTIPELVPNEVTILQQSAEGKTSTQIGKMLSLSGRTVEGLIHKLKVKLRAVNMPNMIAIAIREKIII